jgi:agmatine/peptidylarginine deiminase
MKRLVLFLALLTLLVCTAAAETVTLSSGANSVTVMSSSATETVLQYRIGSFEKIPVNIDGSEWYHILMPKEGVSQEKGYPQLPVFNRSIIIDNNALMALDVYDLEYQDIELPVAPSKGVITRNIDPATIPYVFDEVYNKNAFYPATPAELSDPYIMRDFRGIVVKTTPFAYNPATRTLRVYTAFKIRVHAAGIDTLNTLNRSRTSISRDFVSLYENRFINWDSFRYTPVDDSFGKLLVICHTNYMSTIQPYVNWKIQKGIPTELVEWSTIGSTATQLQTYIQNRYNADNNLTYVQLVGDAPQIPSLSSGGGGSDPSFSLVAGSDNYPDIFIGRFSAETAAQVTAQINKAIAYERDVTTSDTWLSRALGIASDEGGSGGDNGESDIAHMNNIRTDLLNYGYTSVDQVYDPGASASTVTTNVNAGRGFMNYVGHGSNTSWVTTGFNNTNASALTNGTKTPFIMDVACVNGNFVSITCFAEAWLRNANGGAVAMYASSINQSWSSPMRAQDEVTDLLIAEAKTTVGGLYYNGSCRMMDVYGSDGVNMFKTWHIFGDASLSSRTKTPIAMNVTHPSSITSGTTSVNVSTGVNNTLVAITYNNVIYGRAFTNSSGNATITLSNPPTGTLNYTITATAHNRVTYVGTIAQTVSAGPWMEVTAANYDDANNDIPEYNESGYFDVTFKNSGTSAASGVTAILSCSTSGITITDNSHTISSLAAGASVQANDAYAITIANNVPDGTVANFTITMTMSGYDPWTYNFSKTINAPALAFGNMTISDPTGDNDGLLDPGETATISIVLNNSGGAASLAGSGTLTCSTSGITVVNGSASFTAISAGGYATLNFTVTAASSMAEGTLAAFVLNAVAGQYSANTTVNVEVGAPMEVVIGNGTSTQSYPIDRYYNYSSHEAIYLTSEIGTAGTIKSIGFYKASGADVNPIESVTVYMKNTSSNTLADGTYSTTGYTQVYSGTWPNTATSGWMEVNLDNQFAYDGSNLSILTIKGNQAWTSNYPVWTYTTASPARARQSRNDNYQPTSLTASTSLPNLKLKIFPTPGMLYPPRELTASATHGSVTLTWQAPINGTPTGYKVYKNNTALTTVTGLTYTDTAVTDGTTYSYKVTALYGSDESDPTATVTATPNMYAPTNLVATGGDSVVMLTWTAAAGREAEEAFSLGSKDRAISSYRIYRDGAALTTVTGTSYSDTNVTNGTTYNYYVTTLYTNPAGESAASNTASATPNIVTEVIIGTGTGSNGTSTACPVNQYYRSLHGQAVYTAAELNAAGVVGPINITKIGFNITGLPSQAMPNFVVRMGHTTATNVSSWISTGLTQVWSSSSYQPTATGWNMYTLSTPFLWNGIDNIVVDTAFNQIASWNYSGTTEYTEVSNGYRYVRQDSSNQGNIFSGGSISSYRPNLKLTLLPNQSGPVILVNPTTLAYGDVAVGSTDTKTFTIQNSGDQTLTGTITTPAGYTVAAARNSTEVTLAGKESRNSLNFSINAGATKTYNLTFAPTAVASYNGNVVIANNSINNTSVNIAVTGTGYIPPTISIDNDSLYAYLQVGTQGADSFTITNTGSQTLIYSIDIEEMSGKNNTELSNSKGKKNRDITGSTLTINATDYTPGTTLDWTFTATNNSTDAEWMQDVTISFPAGVTVNSATNFVGGDGGDMTPNVTSGNGVTITWHGETSSGWGVIYSNGDSASATVNVTIGSGFSGDLTLPWTLHGDEYEYSGEPHTLSGSIVLPSTGSPDPTWYSASPLSGSIAAGQSETVTVNFSAVDMAVGSYYADLTITSNDPVNPTLVVDLQMDVWDEIVTDPLIAVTPASVSGTAVEGASTTATVTVTNNGGAALTWSTSSSFATWGTVSPTSGTIAAGGNTVLTLTLNAAALTAGTYNANMVITSNAVNEPSLTVPVSFTVEAYVEPSDIRFIAEWEPATGVLIAYANGFGLPYPMIADLSNRGNVYVLVTSSNQGNASSQLSSNGVNMSNVSFIIRDGVNTYWTRDYGPWSIFDANGEMAIVDFRYNRNRPYDNAVNAILDDQFGFGYYYMPLVATGGNVMTDGQGKMMSTNLIMTENDGVQNSQVTEYSYTLAEIEDLVAEYLGVNEYFMYADPLSNSSIDHIDCHAKLLDVDKVMIARVPVGHSNYTALENVVDYWESKTSSYGTPYQIFRVDQTSENEPYANSFIFNNKIYVPQWNSTASAADQAAIAAYQTAMPGYTVQGYYSSSWLSDDAAHCRVHTIFDEQMIHLAHVQPTSATANSYVTLDVTITHSNPLNGGSTYIAYRHSTTGQWQTIPLTLVSGNNWTASVPTPALGQTLYYYILATDTTGRSAKLPLCGASDPFELLVDTAGANNAPTIALPETFEFDMNGNLVVDFSQYVDDVDGDTLTLSYSGNTNVNVAINGLTVTFSATADWYGIEALTFTVSDGTDTASDDVNVKVNLTWLAVPDVSVSYIDATPDYVKLQWSAILNANYYQIWVSADPYGTYSFLGQTTDTYWNDMDLSHAMRFYKVIASNESYPYAK